LGTRVNGKKPLESPEREKKKTADNESKQQKSQGAEKRNNYKLKRESRTNEKYG